MMNNIKDAEKLKKLDELRECIEKCRQCDCVATLKKFLERSDGSMNHLDAGQAVCKDVKSIVYINENFMYVTLQTADKIQIQRIKSMWETMLQRSTQKTLEGEAGDFALVIDLIKQELENSLVYTISFIQPVFVSSEDQSITLVFTVDNMYFGKETVTLDEIEYEEMIENESGNAVFSETEEFIGHDGYFK